METIRMNIGILAMASKDSGGVYQYTLSMLETFKNFGNKSRFNYIQISYDKFPKILDEAIIVEAKKAKFSLKLKRALHGLTGIRLGDLLDSYNHPKLKEIDIVISPIISLFPYHMGKPYVVTIHDLQHKYYPEFFTWKERLVREIIYRTGKYANLVVCESNFVKKDIMKFLSIPEEKVRVILSPPPQNRITNNLNLEKLEEIKSKYNLMNKFLFYPAHFWYHKNHLNLIRAIHHIKETLKEKISVIFVGNKENNFENIMNEINRLKLGKQVRYLGYVPEEDMPCLYKLSTALVMPTLFESLSMPVWEAFYLGCPVVSSNVCALPEQVGEAGLLFDPLNVEEMAEKIYRIWTDEDLRQDLTKKGYERVKNMTLENYAKQWVNVIDEALVRIKT